MLENIDLSFAGELLGMGANILGVLMGILKVVTMGILCAVGIKYLKKK